MMRDLLFEKPLPTYSKKKVNKKNAPLQDAALCYDYETKTKSCHQNEPGTFRPYKLDN